MTRSVRLLSLLNWTGHLLLGVGLFAPCMTITPRMEALSGIARWLGLVKDPETYSILSGTIELLRGGNVLVGIVLFLFSIVTPVAKLVVLRACLADLRAGRPLSRAHAFAARISKFSMVDVFVIALMVVASKSFPGGTTIDIEWGTYAFAGAALLSVLVSAGVGRVAIRPAPAL